MPVSSRIPAPRQPIPGITQSLRFLGHPTPLQHPAWLPSFLQRAATGFPVPDVPCFVTLGWCFTPVSIRVVTMRQCTAWPEHLPFWACLSTGLASCAHLHRACAQRKCRCDDASTTPSLIVIHSHLLDGIAASLCSLPPSLPASDPRLPNARLGRVLSLHHLEGKTFTYRDTQLSRYNDLAAHPLYLAIQFRANGSHTKHAQMKWEVKGSKDVVNKKTNQPKVG